MTECVYENDNSIQIANPRRDVEVYVFDAESEHFNKGDVMITVREEASWDSQYASFKMTAEEATKLKEFLIRKGY